FGDITPLLAGGRVDFDEAGAYRSNPHSARTIIGKSAHRRVAEGGTAVVSELPAVGIPVTRAASSRADPENPTAVLVEGHHIAIAQAARIARIVAVVREFLRGGLE